MSLREEVERLAEEVEQGWKEWNGSPLLPQEIARRLRAILAETAGETEEKPWRPPGHGYQPHRSATDPSNPPRGGSGVPPPYRETIEIDGREVDVTAPDRAPTDTEEVMPDDTVGPEQSHAQPDVATGERLVVTRTMERHIWAELDRAARTREVSVERSEALVVLLMDDLIRTLVSGPLSPRRSPDSETPDP